MTELKDLLPGDVETCLVFFVNGKKVIEHSPDPEWTLLWYLRRKLHLTGTKYGCGEGGCGACTVMVSQYLRTEDKVKHIAVNACLTPLCAMHGLAVTTVEGIGSTQDRLHPVQERLAKAHGSQCGFCTPGIVMSMYTLLRSQPKINYNEIEIALQGNLCRCTGYRPIIEAFKTFTEDWEIRNISESNKQCSMGSQCCKLKNNKNDDEYSSLYDKSTFLPYNETQEPIFPPELKLNKRYDDAFLMYTGVNVIWIRPNTLDELVKIKSTFPDSKIVVGNTEIGVEVKFKKKVYPMLIYPSRIADMNVCKVNANGVKVGAAVTLSDLHEFSKNMAKTEEGKIIKAVNDMLHWFAGRQVRNVASVVGNIITASPISDLNPILMASASRIIVKKHDQCSREITIDETFFESYRKTVLENDEIVTSVEIPFSTKNQYFKAYKQARRKDDDISIVTGAFNVVFETNSDKVVEARLCFGGMCPTTVNAVKSSAKLVGQKWSKDMLQSVFTGLVEEFHLDISTPGGMPDYRKALCLGLFFRFYLYVQKELRSNLNGLIEYNDDISGYSEILLDEVPSSVQCFEINDNKSVTDTVGRPLVHLSAYKQVTGEAIYCDDIPYMEEELYLALVFSKEAHAKVKAIDASKALALPGVETFLSAVDLNEDCNKLGPIIKDEKIFYNEIVTSRACVIGAIVAQSESIARKATNLINVTYEKLEPVIITIEDAIKYSSFFDGYPRSIKKGNTEENFQNSNLEAEGSIRSGAQEHFYLETISAYAVRKEDELEIISTTQNPAEIAQIAAQTLRLPNHKVVSKVKRIGGGFGGKETRATILALPVAIAAYKLKKPVRAVLKRDEDMQATGYRHPCLIKYQVAFTKDGVITGARFDMYINAGNSMDISCAMVERAMTHVDNCYFIPNVDVNAYLCKTNMPSNTAFRGFGAPKAMLVAETMIRKVAQSLNISYEEIVERNMYREGHLTHFNQTLTYCTITRCWKQCIESSNYWQRKRDVEAFNRQNRWKKKGLTLVPTKYGISFQVDVLMQAGALLLVYNDGSVLLSIGGIEMGQGLFTKMIQVASKALEIEVSKIHISEMATDKVPNSSPTAGSISSDLYGMAVINACEVINQRLLPYKVNNPNVKWEEWVLSAYLDRINLSATGFYAAPKIQYDPKTNSGDLFEYFTYGVACSEVIIDCLTGDHKVLRTDIVMDVGDSLNPAIDIGQIEGAFTQGYGFHTIEEMIFSPEGEAISRGPGAYKIPGFSDIPKVFNVSLLKGAPNPRAVYSSKAIGEPPLFLAASVFFAIKEAIRSARFDAGVSLDFDLNVPATSARIRMACEDHITEQVKATVTSNGKPWNVIA